VARSWVMNLTGHKPESVYRRYAVVCEAGSLRRCPEARCVAERRGVAPGRPAEIAGLRDGLLVIRTSAISKRPRMSGGVAGSALR
jgi:hypothetical protein